MTIRTHKLHVPAEKTVALNIGKYKSEWAKFTAAWKSGGDTATHTGGKTANRFVEACRASPYIAGHLMLVGLAVAVLLILLK